MKPEEVPDRLVEKAARALAGLEPGEAWPTNEALGGGLTGTRDDEFRDGMLDQARHVLAAVLSLEEVWVGGPDALPLPPQVITSEGVFHADAKTPLEITDEEMRAGGWKRRRRLSTEWEDA